MILKTTLPSGTIVPDHIAIVLDGNGRWARAQGLPATRGHEESARNLVKLMDACRDFGVHTLTVWGFSTENWKRPVREVSKLFGLMEQVMLRYRQKAMKDGIRFVHLGRKNRLPRKLLQLIESLEEDTKYNKNYVLNVAIDYGGRDELLRAIKKIIEDKIPVNKIDEDLFSSYLDTGNQPYPNPDLFIRPSGEQRTSGLMPWQTVYSEFYWEEAHLPDITVEHIKKAILDYSRRRRRFGGKGKEKHMAFKPQVVANLELSWWRLGKIPEGKKFGDFAVEYLKEQYGLSKKLAKEAAGHLFEAVTEKDKKDWERAKKPLIKFYKLIKKQVKLAFEPEILTSWRIKLWQEVGNGQSEELEEVSANLTAEEYRLSKLQAAKAAHLRVLAERERFLAQTGEGELHWELASDYLQKYYKAIKERVA